MATKNKRKWAELTPTQRVLVVCGAVLQLTLFALAQRDLSQRSAEAVNGPKWAWRLATMINFLGPIAYFRCGRKSPQAAS